MVIENETDDARPSATDYIVVDTLDTEYQPIESESPYALEIGAEVPGRGPAPDPEHDGRRPGPITARCWSSWSTTTSATTARCGSRSPATTASGEVILDI